MKIRPDEYAGLDDETWLAIETLQEILRERDRADRSLREIAKELLGLETRFSDISEINEEVFADIELPGSVRETIEEAESLAESESESAALDLLREEFGGVCSAERPDRHTVGTRGRDSLCHRHRDEHAEPHEEFGDVFAGAENIGNRLNVADDD